MNAMSQNEINPDADRSDNRTTELIIRIMKRVENSAETASDRGKNEMRTCLPRCIFKIDHFFQHTSAQTHGSPNEQENLISKTVAGNGWSNPTTGVLG